MDRNRNIGRIVSIPSLARAVTDTQSPKVANVPKFPGIIGTFMGRDALSLVTSCLNLGIHDTVLLPVYTCQEVLKSFTRRAKVIFYDVRPDLTIDPETIRTHLKRGGVRMVLITDYFGFLQPYRGEIRQICDEHGACLVEDCAHSLLTTGSGKVGGFAVYSLRKILPIPDGGGLRVNQEGITVSPEFYPRIYSNMLSLTAIAKARLNIHTEMLSRARICSHASKVTSPANLPKELARTLPLSSFAHSRIVSMSLAEVTENRRADFRFWQEVSSRNPSIVPVLPSLPDGVCPFGFPVRVKNSAAFEAVARKAGIHLGVHWRLDTQLGTECTTSHGLSRQIVTLPLYPYLSDWERESLARIVIADWRQCA